MSNRPPSLDAPTDQDDPNDPVEIAEVEEADPTPSPYKQEGRTSVLRSADPTDPPPDFSVEPSNLKMMMLGAAIQTREWVGGSVVISMIFAIAAKAVGLSSSATVELDLVFFAALMVAGVLRHRRQ